MPGNHLFYRCCIIASLLMCVCGSSAVAVEDEIRLASGLRERRLFEQAEFVCREALKQSNVGSKQNDAQTEVALVVELIRIRSDQAKFAALDQRAPFWQAARTEAERFLKDHPQHPRKLIVQLQAALIDSARVQLFLQEQEFGALSDLESTQALELSRSLRENLRAIDQRISKQLQESRNKSSAGPTMTVAELANLKRNVQFQLAQAGFQRANLYGTDSQDQTLNQTSALSEVLSQLSTLQRVNPAGSDLWWQTQLALARCNRQLADFENAQATLDRAGEGDLKRQRRKWHGPILAEQAELLLARGVKNQAEVEVARKVLLAIDRQSIVSAQLDWLALKLVTAISEGPTTELQRNELLDQATRRADLIARQHGPWWGTRARQLVAAEFKDSGQGGELEKRFSELAQKGDVAMNAGQFAEATTVFGQAAKIAKQSGDTSAWRSCEVNASRALEQLGRHEAAARKLLEIAKQQASHSSAASIHLRGIWNLAQVKTSSNAGESAFSKASKEHLERWPGSKTADQVRLWLGKQQLVDKQYSSAAQTLLEVSQSFSDRAQAVRIAAQALERSVGTESDDSDVLSTLDGLVKERPRDVSLLMSQARAQTEIGLSARPVRLETALASWRGLARRLKPETDPWFEAKYNVSRLLFAAEEVDKASQLLNYLAALPSGWKQSSFERQFDELQRLMQERSPQK